MHYFETVRLQARLVVANLIYFSENIEAACSRETIYGEARRSDETATEHKRIEQLAAAATRIERKCNLCFRLRRRQEWSVYSLSPSACFCCICAPGRLVPRPELRRASRRSRFLRCLIDRRLLRRAAHFIFRRLRSPLRYTPHLSLSCNFRKAHNKQRRCRNRKETQMGERRPSRSKPK